jgi:hypothetical protein
MAQVGQSRDAEASPGSRAERSSGVLGLDRFTLAIVVGALVLVAALFLIVLAQPNRADPMDESRPAGVIHNFYLALLNDDAKKAYGYLSAEAQSKTPYEQFAREVSGGRSRGRMRIDEERIEGDTARVTVRKTYGSDGGFFPFSSREYSHDVTYVLRLERGVWKLVPAQPHGYYGW